MNIKIDVKNLYQISINNYKKLYKKIMKNFAKSKNFIKKSNIVISQKQSENFLMVFWHQQAGKT